MLQPAEPTSPVPHGTGPALSQEDWPRLVLAFNLRPASYADRSWWPQRLSALVSPAAFDGDLALQRWCSACLVRELGLSQCFDWSLREPAARLFLVDSAALSRLALAVGVAAHRRSLRQVVLKPQLAALRQALGDAMDVLWLPFAEAVPHAMPGLGLRSWPQAPAPVDLARRLRQDGFEALLCVLCASHQGHAAHALRAPLRMPRQATRSRPAEPDAAQARVLLRAVIDELVPRFAAPWNWLF